MKFTAKGWSPRLAATTLAIVLAIAGASALGIVYAQHQTPPPEPPLAAAGRIIGSSAAVATSTARHATRHRKPVAHPAPAPIGLPSSPPTEIRIPSIGVHSSIVDLARNTDGSVEVPSSFHVVGWYRFAVTPGQIGPSVFLGHVDSESGPGIFYRLGQLHIGDRVTVKREDGRSVTFAITGVREYAKASFPSIDVYGNTSGATIRLVTCGGAFDRATHHYLSNIVAFGQLI